MEVQTRDGVYRVRFLGSNVDLLLRLVGFRPAQSIPMGNLKSFVKVAETSSKGICQGTATEMPIEKTEISPQKL